ncbi:MAG: hypothetical protein ACR2OD_12915, partial [Gaiellaceae bacterium]
MTTPTAVRGELGALARELLGSERFAAFVAKPGAVRVSEPLLPAFLAAFWRAREVDDAEESGLVVVVPEDGDARDLAEAVSWYIGDEQVGVLTSRGVRRDSGLLPPVHLVGERARALHVAEQGGLVCASAIGFAEGVAARDERAERVELSVGDETPVDLLVELLVEAGYEHVERVEERGQLAVRGGLIDVYPSTGREPVRVDMLGDEIESLRAFSPYTQRTIRPLEHVTIFPASERRTNVARASSELEDDGAAREETELVPPFAFGDLVWELDAVLAAIEEEALDAPD